jgi:hypothetical protein
MAVQLDTLAETEAAAAGGAFGGAEFGDEALADEGLGGEDLGGEDLGGELEGEAAPEAEEPPALLAAPEGGAAKRDDKPPVYRNKKTGKTTTVKSKGKEYTPKKHDDRPAGARKRQMKALSSHEIARMPTRQVRMNLPAGAKEMLGLGKGIFENKKTNYEKEEKEIFEVKDEIKELFKDLEQL